MLTAQQESVVLKIDSQANKILAEGGEHAAILGLLVNVMGDVESLIRSIKHDELDSLCAEYPGFYRVMQVLESLAVKLSSDNETANKASTKFTTAKNIEQQNAELIKELDQVIIDALLKLRKLVDCNLSNSSNYLLIVEKFLVGIISTAVDLVEINVPGAKQIIYAKIEAAAKIGGLQAINAQQFALGAVEHSISDLGADDYSAAMNYLGQILNTALIKGLHELPMPLRSEEMLLRGVESLLANLLHAKFKVICHKVLDDFCEHVHLCLSDLEACNGNVTDQFYNNLTPEKDAKYGKH